MEILFVTGKGGVGKSAVAAALALNRAESGKKTALVELGDHSFYQDYFDLTAAGKQVNYQGIPLKPSLQVALWSGAECLKEYAIHLLKIESLYRLFFENPVSRTLINIAPALPELAILGKITSGPPRNVGPKMPYDCIVVDAFATGHFAALLQAPLGMMQAIRLGPMAEQSRGMLNVLRDSAICKYFVVALPEELPVLEGIELAGTIEKLTSQKPTLILNRCMDFDPRKESAEVPAQLKEFQQHVVNLQQRQDSSEQSLAKTGDPVLRLPWILENNGWSVVNGLATALKERGYV